MNDINDMRMIAADFIDKVKSGKQYNEDQIDLFCKLSNMIISSLKVEISYNYANGTRTIIPFLECKDNNKLIEHD